MTKKGREEGERGREGKREKNMPKLSLIREFNIFP